MPDTGVSHTLAVRTVGEVLEKRFDPLIDDIRRQAETANRIKHMGADASADVLRSAVSGREPTGKERDMTFSHTSFSAS